MSQAPTTSEINANIIAQLESSLNQTIPLLPKSFLRVLSKVLAAVFVILYKYAGFMFLQIFVQTASDKTTTVNGTDIIPLNLWGDLVGVGLPTPATQAEMIVDITVQNTGGSLPSGTQLVAPTNGVTYITIGAVSLSAATVQATIRAVSDQSGGGGAGAIGNIDVGGIVTFANPLADVEANTIVASSVVTGADGEATEVYRQRVLDRFQKRPQGGAPADYELWGEEVAGIINIYPYTGANPGEVDVYAEATVASSGDPDGFPTAAQLQAVEDAIELDDTGLASRRPANAYVNVASISRKGFDVTISGLVSTDAAAAQTEVDDALTEYFWDADLFIEGLTILPRKDRLTQTGVIGVVDAILTARGDTFQTAIFDIAGVGGSITEYGLQLGEKAKLIGVTYA